MYSTDTVTRLVQRLSDSGVISYMFPGLSHDDPGSKKMVCKAPSLPKIARLREPAVSSKSFRYELRLDKELEADILSESDESCQLTEEQILDFEESFREAKVSRILKAINEIQKEFGVTIEEIEAILSYQVKLSRLLITESSRLFLMDFDSIEVKMDSLTKTVFLLFLAHPEGIEFKNIADYRSEIESIYGRISHSGNPATIRSSLDRLCNPVECNSLNEKVSRVKRAFTLATDDRIAKYYYIDGPAGGVRKIALDRSLVVRRG